MGIRRGVADIENRNKQIDVQRSQSYIPELRLFNDGEVAVFRFLTDDPLDIDYHEVLDKSVSNRPAYHFCKKGDNEPCEMCENQIGSRARLFSFWVYVYKILHPSQNKDGTWVAVTSGTKTMYQEDVNSVRLFRSKFGKGQYLWKDIYEFYEENNTWKDREFAFKRRGASGDRNTTYKVSALDKSPMPKELIDIVSKLPTLEAVARGHVTNLDLDGKKAAAAAETKDKPVAEKTSLKPKTNKTSAKGEPKTVVDLDSKLEDGAKSSEEDTGDAQD